MNAHNEAARLECLGWLRTAGLSRDTAMQVIQRLPLRLMREISEQLTIAEGERNARLMPLCTGPMETALAEMESSAGRGRVHTHREEQPQ